MDEHLIYNKLSKTEEVLEVFPLFSEWDIILKIQAETEDELGKIILKKIRSLKGVLSTKTLVGY